MKRSLAGVLVGLVVLSGHSYAAVPGSFDGREIADAVFRRMDNRLELHGGIYVGQTNKAGKPAALPVFHEVIEMTGILDGGVEVYIEVGLDGLRKVDLRVKEGGVGLIGFSNFDNFQRAHPAYYGSFMHPSYPGMEIRKNILRKAQELKNRDKAIDYIVMPGESASKLLYKYFDYYDTAGSVFTDADIRRMRSDAFVEYCYAFAGRPIMADNITLRAGADALEAKWFPLPVYPSDQRDRMTASLTGAPVLKVYDKAGVLVSDIVRSTDLNVELKDFQSGPGLLTIQRSQGEYLEGESRDIPFALKSNGDIRLDSIVETRNVPVSVSEGITAGHTYHLQAYDHAGNSSSVFNFSIPPLPAININSENALYNNFRGVSATSPSTLGRNHTFDFSEPMAGVSAVSIDGPQGNLWSQTFDPPVPSTFTSLSDLPVGNYTATALNAIGEETKTLFNIGNFNVAVSTPGSSQVLSFPSDPLAGGSASVTVKADVEGFNELDRIELTDPLGRVLETQALSGYSGTVSFTLPSLALPEPLYMIDQYPAGDGPAMSYALKLWDKKGNYKRDFFTLAVDANTECHDILTPTAGSALGAVVDTNAYDDGTGRTHSQLPGALVSNYMVFKDTSGELAHNVSFGLSDLQWRESGAGGITKRQSIGAMAVKVRTGDQADLSDAVEYTILSGQIYASTMPIDGMEGLGGGFPSTVSLYLSGPFPSRVPAKRYIQAKMEFQEASPEAFLEELCAEWVPYCSGDPEVCRMVNCDKGLVPEKITFSNYLSWGGMIASAQVYPENDYNAVDLGENVRVDLAGGAARVDFTEVTAAGTLSATAMTVRPPSGFLENPANVTYEIVPNGSLAFAGTTKLTLKYNPAGLTPEQIGWLKIVKVVDPVLGKYEILGGTPGASDTISANITQFGRYIVAVPEYGLPTAHAAQNLEFLSGETVTSQAYDMSSPEGQGVLQAMKSRDLMPVGPVTRLGPDGLVLEPSGVVTMRYSDGDIAALGVDENSIAIYQITADGGSFARLPYLTLNTADNVLTARVPGLTSLFAILASSKQVENIPPSVYPDGIPPETTISYSGRALQLADGAYISSAATVVLSASDPQFPDIITSGVNLTNYILNPDSSTVVISTYTGPFTLPEGANPLYYLSVDNAGNYEFPRGATVYMDATAPETSLSASFMNMVPGYSSYAVVSGSITLAADDPSVKGAASGVYRTFYLVDRYFGACPGLLQYLTDPLGQTMIFTGQPGTCSNPVYSGEFSLSTGSHVVRYLSFDNVGNAEEIKGFRVDVIQGDITAPQTWLTVNGSTLTAGSTTQITTQDQVVVNALDPAGEVFSSGLKAIYYLIDVSPDSCQSEPDLSGPGGTCQNPLYSAPFSLETGTHAVYYTAQDNAGNQGAIQVSYFEVSGQQPVLYIAPSSGPIGLPFTIEGAGFGAYSAGTTVVLLGGTTAPLTLWTDTKIQGTIPGALAAGQYPVVVKRGGEVLAEVLPFTVTQPALYALTPSSGAIGIPFSVTGESFGNYVAGYTRVLLGGATMPLTLWTDTQIKGTIPGTLPVGDYELLVERALNGGVVQTSTATFSLRNMEAYWLAPSSGPIGMPFTITGTGFGNYALPYTSVLIGGTAAPLTLWTDSKIQGTVPGGLASGQHPVLVERRTSDGGLMQTSPMTFEVVNVDVASMTPVAGPIGLPFTIYGAGFGNYSAGYTKVLLGGTTCPLTLWTDTQIKGTIPGNLAPGEYPVVVERTLNGGQAQSVPLVFTVAAPEAYSLSPSSGPIGLPFTITGGNFGNYVANYTKVLVGGATAPLTLWTDTQIKGSIPGSLAAGDHELVVERALNGGVVRTSTFTFTVGTPYLDTVSPSTASVVAPFTITGYNFGNYVANYTKVLIGGATTALTLWTDTKIQGKLPYLPAGSYTVQVQRYLNGALSESATAYIAVEEPVISSMTPASGAVGTVFNLYGTGFGPYEAAIAKVFIGGAQCALSLWTDTRITGTVPTALSYGTHTVVAARGQALANALEFYIPGGYTPSMMRLGTTPAALEFKLGEVYVYPDPAKGGKVPTFHIEVGTADSVKLKIYTVAGQLAHEATLTGNPQAVGSVYAYEYAWSGRIASGVYYYTVEAERAGKKLKAKGKFAVVR
jgi:hypothetical protein